MADSESLSGINSGIKFKMTGSDGFDYTDLYYVVVDEYTTNFNGTYGETNTNYEVMIIKAREIEITTKSASKKHDGKELVCQEIEITKGSLVQGHELGDYTDLMEAAITDIGTTPNTIKTAKIEILDADEKVVARGVNDTYVGDDGKEHYNNYQITVKTGTLTVT